MSLNKLCIGAQASPQPTLNPRFNSLVVDNDLTINDLVVNNNAEVKGDLKVDGKFTNGIFVYPQVDNNGYMRSDGAGNLLIKKSSYGTVAYVNGVITYPVPVTTASVVVSLNRNSASNNNNITLNPIGLNVIDSGDYLVTGTVSFNTDTPGTEYAVGIEVDSILGRINYVTVGATFSELSISEIRQINAGQLVTINCYTLAGLTNVNVISWNLTIKNVD